MQLQKDQNKLIRIVSQHPLPAFSEWWEMGEVFIRLISEAIWKQWKSLYSPCIGLDHVREHVRSYLRIVYQREADPTLVDEFISQNPSRIFYSGEFDTLSFAFYRTAFDILKESYAGDTDIFENERRQFTRRVGKEFFDSVCDHLQLKLPSDLKDAQSFQQLQSTIDHIGRFLLEDGYLKDSFCFKFSLDEAHHGKRIVQAESDFIYNLQNRGVAYALYIMGYPAILPSAVYLYQLSGEAQHHSSRMIEELFGRAGYKASEVNDFDPSGHPSDRVVELWSISN